MAARELPAGRAAACGGQSEPSTRPPGWGPPSERAPRGWYRNPDRRDPAQLRFWDGRQWTNQTRRLTMCRIEHKPAGDVFTNAILTVLTMGLWAPVWMVRASDRYRVRE